MSTIDQRAGGRSIAKVYVDKTPLTVQPVYLPAGIRVRSFAQLGELAFVEAIATCTQGSTSRDVLCAPAHEQLRDGFETPARNSSMDDWIVFERQGDLVALAMPTEYGDTPGLGTLVVFGVAPQWRAKGFGTVFHRYALNALARRGVTRYLGSTDVYNRGMRRIFERNGCEVIGIREHGPDGPIRWIERSPMLGRR